MTKKGLCRVLSAVICAVLLIGCLYVPVSFSAFAQSQTTVYDFSYCVDNTANANAATTNGVGYFGWGFQAKEQTLAGVQKNETRGYRISGGYRLHDSNGLCELEPSSTYIISFKVKVPSGVKKVAGMTGSEKTVVSIGWGANFNSSKSGEGTNYVNEMHKKEINVLTSTCDADTYSLNIGSVAVDAAFSDEWKTVSYELKTPADFAGKDNVLAFWLDMYYGIECYIDDVSVTKLGAGQGVIVAFDEYSGMSDVYIGNVGETVTLSDVSNRAKQSDHTFKGWYKDTGRTEQVTEVAYAAEKQTVYTLWDAPVVYTFKNTLTGEDTIVDGTPGEAIEFPEDPVDENGEKWFMGWYTTEAYTVEFTDKYYSYVNKTVYSLFQSEKPELKQDFENYTKDAWTPNGTTNVRKSNRDYFADMMEKQSLVTYGGSGYAIKFNWDSTMTKIPSDPNTYNTVNRHNQMDMYFWLGAGLDDKTDYVVSFKYKVEKTDADLTFYAASAMGSNIWGHTQTYNGITVKNADLVNEWQEISFPITTSYKADNGKTMYLGVKLSKNTDTVVYFDDVEIKALMQPYESKVTVVTGVSESYEQIGRRNEAIELETPVHPEGADFLGWYLDQEHTIPVENLVYKRVPYTLYARWGALPLTFEDYEYPKNTDSFGKLVHIDESGLGIDDDYSLRFDFKGNYLYKVDAATGENILYNTRYNQIEHCATIAQNVKNNTYYKITYSYKIVNANSDVKFRIFSARPTNIWDGNFRTEYADVAREGSMVAKGWQTVSVILKTDIKSSGTSVGSSLFMVFNVGDNTEDTVVDVVVDNVIVEEISGNYIIFDGNAVGAEKDAVSGKEGAPFEIPTVKCDKNELIGWYTDKECTTPFTATVIPKGETIVYAKWKVGPMSFQTYPYYTTKDNNGFGKLLRIDKTGLGIDGDAAMRFDFRGDYVYKVNNTGELAYYSTRAKALDHIFTIKTEVQNNTPYKITYKYKVLNANADVSIIPYSGYYHNIWVPDTSTKYEGGQNVIKAGEATDWQTFTGYITTDLRVNKENRAATALYLIFNVDSADVSAVADVLVDDLLVEPIVPPYVMFNMENGKPNYCANGKSGEKIVFPETPTAFAKTFTGWYTDKECTVPFTATTFTDGMAAVVYAGYTLANQFTYTFEDYDLLPKQFTPNKYFMEDAFWKTHSNAKSGNGVVEFDRTVPFNSGHSFAAVAEGSEILRVDPSRQYLITFSYCIAKKSSAAFTLSFATAYQTNCWAYNVVVSPSVSSIPALQKVGEWVTKTISLDLSKMDPKGDCVYFRVVGGKDGILLLDDVTVTVVPEGYGAIAIDNGGCNEVPAMLTGKLGESYANRLPKAPKVNGKFFKGYFEKDKNGIYTALNEETMVFGEVPKTVFARFIDYKITQDFEGSFVDATKAYTGLNIFDFDYELYNATAEGNSRDNVTSGKYSLHRKGQSRYFESSAVLTPDNHVAEGERYKVTFKVKMGKHLHTDGAIKIASSKNQNYSWDTTGDWYPVVAIKDLTDGQWHTVSYIYNSVESFFAIQTPGYAEFFIDDVVFELITDGTPVSTPVEFTEYVPVKRDENGNIIEMAADEIDVNSIVDASLKLRSDSGISTTVIIIVAAAGVLVIAAAVVLLIIFKKKKVKKA